MITSKDQLNSNNPIPFFLLTGFLGSGKTTLLKNFLTTHASGRRILVVQNEFAPSGMDGQELRRTGLPFQIIEVQGGSVFCVCRLADFRRGLGEILASADPPEAVILEATGLADPLAVIQMLDAPELRGRIFLRYSWCIADAANFMRMSTALRCVRHQARIADAIIINKTEKIKPDEIEPVCAHARILNPLAEIHVANYCRIALDQAFAPLTAAPVAMRRAGEHSDIEPSGRPPIVSLVLRSGNPVPRVEFEKFVNQLAARTLRIKGFALLQGGGALAVQAAGDDLQVTELQNYDGQTELVLLADNLDTDTVRARFATLVS